MFARLPLFVRIWFALDLFLALFPPLHWVVSDAYPLGGVPMSVLYIVSLSAFIALSVVVAYVAERTAQI